MSVGEMKELKVKGEGSTRLTYTGLCEGLEHLKMETKLIDERVCDLEAIGTPSIFKRIRSTEVLTECYQS